MKSIKILIVLLCVLTILSSGNLIRTSSGTKTIKLESTVKNVPVDALNKSAVIISSRLKMYGISSADIKISGEGMLNVVLPENTDIGEIENLLTSRGDVQFFETLGQNEIKSLFGNDRHLLGMLNVIKDSRPSDPRIGCTDKSKWQAVQDYLDSKDFVKDPAMKWKLRSDNSRSCLFALKTDNGKPLVNRSDIEAISFSKGDSKIMIRLKSSAAGKFAEATRINMHKAIAIVIDEKVCSWPIVQSVIEKGEIEVTGDFTDHEASVYPVLFNNEMLPVSFRIIG
jgi:preprotein translocase subunit SecD